MDSSPSSLTCSPAHDIAPQKDREGCFSQVDPLLKEALENPRHRLTVLRMDFDIQRFMQNSVQHQFVFQHFPNSYLRCIAHRVAQHYGLQTMVLDNIADGLGSRIIVRKTSESRFPVLCLSDIPAKQCESEKTEQVKVSIRPRPNKGSPSVATEVGTSPTKTVEERKEEYDKARARIFSGSSSPDIEGPLVAADERSLCSSGDGTSKIAIYRDSDNDRSDPDYDRSYNKYFRGLARNQNFSSGPCNLLQSPFLQYEAGPPHLHQLPKAHNYMGYKQLNQNMSPFCAVGCNQTSSDAVYIQWPIPAMMYAHSYGQLGHAVFQPPVYQLPLSFEHPQNR